MQLDYIIKIELRAWGADSSQGIGGSAREADISREVGDRNAFEGGSVVKSASAIREEEHQSQLKYSARIWSEVLQLRPWRSGLGGASASVSVAVSSRPDSGRSRSRQGAWPGARRKEQRRELRKAQ